MTSPNLFPIPLPQPKPKTTSEIFAEEDLRIGNNGGRCFLLFFGFVIQLIFGRIIF